MTNKNPNAHSYSIVVPVYNSEEIIPELVARLEKELSMLGSVYELILINDCSHDCSWEVICQLTKEYHWIRGINLMRNYGQHNAILCGIRVAQYSIIVTMDDDLQNPPEEIPKLLDKLNEGYDVVYGTPLKEQHGLFRDFASQLTKFALQNAMGANTARKVSSFRVFKTQIRDAFVNYQNSYVFIDVLLTWGTTRFVAIPVQHSPRHIGQSNYTFGKLLTHALNMITGFSVLPLQFASLLGFVFTLFGLLVFIYVIGRFFFQGSIVPGFPFLASIIAIFSGTQLFVLGIIGEYLARVHFRMMEKPTYVIRTDSKN